MRVKRLTNGHVKIRPLININHSYWHTAFVFEALFSATVFTLTFILDDMLTDYVEKHNVPLWKKYLVHLLAIFVIALMSIYMFCILFGYGEAIIPQP